MHVSHADVLGSSSNIGLHAPPSCRIQEVSAQKPGPLAVTRGHSCGGIDHCGTVSVQECSTGDQLWCADALVQTSPSGDNCYRFLLHFFANALIFAPLYCMWLEDNAAMTNLSIHLVLA